MKKLMMLALAGCFVFGMSVMPVQAQMGQGNMGQKQMHRGMKGKYGRGMNAEQQLKHMSLMLDLTSAQQAQMKPILEERMQQRMSIMRDDSLTRAQRRQKMMALRNESRTKIESVLNAKQKEKYQKMEQMRMERMQKRMKDRGMGQPQ